MDSRRRETGEHALTARRLADGTAFLKAAGPWLLHDEAQNCLILGIAGGAGRLQWAAVVEEDGEVVAGGIRSPGRYMIIASAPERALRGLAADYADAGEGLPGIVGPSVAAETLARLWTERTGKLARRGMDQLVYRLSRVQDVPRAKGRPREATEADVSIVARWVNEFARDAGVPEVDDAVRYARERIARRTILLWEGDGEPVSCAGASGETPNGTRVNLVWTPPEHRGHGYATSLVADLSRRILASGRRYCFLHTDRSAPVPNRIYPRIGYEPVGEFVEMLFDS